MKPINLKISNFFSHKESDVSFDFDSALLIGNTDGDYRKSNGSGKSAVFEALTWSLYSKSRAPQMNDLVRWGEDICSVVFTFEEKGQFYKIERKRNRVNSSSSVSFYKKDDVDIWVDISGSTSTLTNKEIEDVIGMDYGTFVNSIYFRQNDISEFAEAEPFKKKEMLKNVVDIGRWDEYEKEAKDQRRALKVDLEVLKNSLHDSEDLDIKKGQAEYQLNSLKDKYKKLKESMLSLEARYSNTFEEYVNMKNSLDTNQYDKIVLEIKSLKKSNDMISSNKKSYESSSRESSSKLKKINENIDSINSELSNLIIDEPVDDLLDQQRNLAAKLKAEYDYNLTLIESIKNKSLNQDNCDVCGQEIGEDLHQHLIEENKNKISSLTNKNLSIKEEVTTVKNKISHLKNLKDMQNKYNKMLSDKQMLLDKQIFYQDKHAADKEKLVEINELLSSNNAKISGLEISLDNLKSPDFAKVKEEVKLLKDEKKEVEEEIFELNKKIAILESELAVLNNKLEENKDIKLKIKDKQEEIVVYDYLSKYLGKSGIQVILINNLIEDLELFCNKILKSICNEELSISLETQKLRSDGASIVETLDLKILKDGYKYDYKSLSGGEKFRIGLSLGLGLSDLTSRYGGGNLEFIMLDEVNAPLDRYGVENLMVSVINKLSENIKILTITHDESLKEKFDYIIDVSKVNGESSVNYYSLN